MTIKIIAFDGDDTLWHHNNYFLQANTQFGELMNRYGDFPDIDRQIDEKHIQDLPVWGYGVKSLTLSMVDLAIELTGGTIPATAIQEITRIGRETHLHPVHLLDHVAETVQILHRQYMLILITKGDLIAQEMKIHKSGLEPYFTAIDVVSEKDEATYRKIFNRMRINPAEVVMIGNTLRSDILPVVRLGGQAIHIPYTTSWHFEESDITEQDKAGYITVSSMQHVPDILANLKQHKKKKLSELALPLSPQGI